MSTNTIYTDLQKRQLAFFEKVHIIHSNKYDYSDTTYIRNRDMLSIICPTHGIFHQTGKHHILGHGCTKCANDKLTKLLAKSTDQFIEEARDVHGDIYDYSKVNYVRASDKVEIICPEHGTFHQQPSVHLNGHSCSICSHERKGFGYLIGKDSIAADDICTLYTIRMSNENEVFYKTGIAKDYEKRHRGISTITGYTTEVISIIIDTRYSCFLLEQKILNKHRKKGNMYIPNIKFNGYTECYKRP